MQELDEALILVYDKVIPTAKKAITGVGKMVSPATAITTGLVLGVAATILKKKKKK